MVVCTSCLLSCSAGLTPSHPRENRLCITCCMCHTLGAPDSCKASLVTLCQAAFMSIAPECSSETQDPAFRNVSFSKPAILSACSNMVFHVPTSKLLAHF